MKFRIFFYFFIFITIGSFGQGCNNKSQILKEIICELIGDEYRYESFKQFYSRIDQVDMDYDYYLKHRKELEISKQVIFIQPIFNEDELLKKEFFIDNLNDSIQKNGYPELFESFLNHLNDKSKINIEDLNSSNCSYRFYSINNNLLFDFKPSERVILSISPVIKSEDNTLACFYLAGGRASYADYFIILHKKGDSWDIIKKWNIGEY